MYTRNNICQRISTSPPCVTSFHSFKSRYDEKTINDYINSLRGDGPAIVRALMEYRSAERIILKHETIAKKVGCCIKTVQRWTNKLAQDGFLTKIQLNSGGFLTKWSPNRYNLGLTKSTQFAYWSHENPDKAELYNTYGILVKRDGKYKFQIETVQQNKSYIKNSLFINKPVPSVTRVTCARARRTEPSWDIFPKKETKRESRLRESLVMLQEEQRKWIQRNKKQDALKDLLLKEPLRSQIFTPQIGEISELLALNERERLKLVAFPDDAINNLLSVVKPTVTEKRPINVKDRVGWIMSLLVKYCKSHNLTVEWSWYFSVCEILGIKALQGGEDPRPLVISGAKSGLRANRVVDSPNCTSDEYRRATEFKGDPIFTMSKDDEIANLEKEIAHFKYVLEDPAKHYHPMFLEDTIKINRNAIRSHEERLTQLRQEITV